MAMTKETIYKVLYDYTKGLPEMGNLDGMLKKWEVQKPGSEYSMPIFNLVNLLANLQEDIRQENNKAAGNGDIEKGMKAIIKNAMKASCNTALHGFFLSENMPAVCDSYRIIRSFVPLEIGEPAQGVDVAGIIKDAKSTATEPLELPAMGELKAYIKIKKAEQPKGMPMLFDLGENMPYVNAVYLQDMLAAFPEAKAYYNPANLHAPLYFENENGEGVLLPVRRG